MPLKSFVLLFIVLAADAAAQPAAATRSELLAAFATADQGRLDAATAARLSGHPLSGWLVATDLRDRIAKAQPGEVRPVLDRLGNQAAGRWLREAWLRELVKRRDWDGFRAAYQGSDDELLRCADLQARLQAGRDDAQWVSDAKALWLTGGSLPPECDAAFARLASTGQLDDVLRWQRLDLAAAKGESGLMRFLAKGMRGNDGALATSYANYVDAPGENIPATWPNDARSREIAASALARLGKRDPDRAERILPAVASRLGMDERQRGRVLYEIALWTVASYAPGSAARLNAVPAVAYDEKLHEWRVREAINRGDDAAALAAIEKMGAAQRSDSRWEYFEARLRERLGQKDAARKLYQEAAASPAFHGWLAADRLKQPYALCSQEPTSDGALRKRVAGNAALVRSLQLFGLDRAGPAAREWGDAVKALNDDERRVAVQLAIEAGWFDRAVFGMNLSADDVRYYSLRFPLTNQDTIRAQSKINSLDPAWVAAQTRAESAFMPKARSAADARGLLQLLPGTGALTARRIGMDWRGGESLYEPVTNLTLGTAYLRQMLDRYSGLPYLAIAAYNAGPAPVDRWMQSRLQMDPDFFVEAIPYKETRDYVARVLAFSVVYDWRLNGKAAALSDRLVGRFDESAAQRRPFVCPVPDPKQS